MTRRVLVVGHADADGHVIVDQLRRNLERVETFAVKTFVDPVRTRDHKSWTHLAEIPEIDGHDIVIFADLMFAPASFPDEADALVEFAQQRPGTRFFVVDHHPLPTARLSAAPNLRSVYRDDVFDCTFGRRTRLMTLAALCEKQSTRADEYKQPGDEDLRLGMLRAAALGGPLPGPKLSALLRANCWGLLAELGRDAKKWHYLPRGRRIEESPLSPALKELDAVASELLRGRPVPRRAAKRSHNTESAMAYDMEQTFERDAFATPLPRSAHARDLEAIVTLLELAALSLTAEPGATFTAEQLLDEARALGGPKISLLATDVQIVLGKAGFLKKVAGGRFVLK